MLMFSDNSIVDGQMVTPSADAPIKVTDVDIPRDINCECSYSGMSLGEEQGDGGPDLVPAGHCWPRLQSLIDLGPQSH